MLSSGKPDMRRWSRVVSDLSGSTVPALVGHWAAEQPGCAVLVTDDSTSRTPSSTPTAPRPRHASPARGVGKGRGSGCCCRTARRGRWPPSPSPASAASGAAEHAAPPARARGAVARRGRQAPPSSSPSSAAGLPRRPGGVAPGARRRRAEPVVEPALPRSADHAWPELRPPTNRATPSGPSDSALRSSTRSTPRSDPPTTSRSSSRRAAAARRRGRSTRTAARSARRAGLERRCVAPTIASTSRCRSSGRAASAPGCSPSLIAGATLVTEAVPDPARTLALLERERVTLFRGWPDQAAPLAADPAFASTDLSALRPGSLPSVLPSRRRRARQRVHCSG